MKHTRTTLPLDSIRIDGGTQARVGIDEETVKVYAETPDGLPPLVVFHDGTDYWLADGFHRVHARRRAEKVDVECEVHKGTREEALWYAIGANKTHGLRRTTADKRKAIELALRHREDASDRLIADHVGVSHHTVAVVRGQVGKLPTSEKTEESSPSKPSPPPKRMGRDGKEYPASSKKSAAEPSTNGTPNPPPPLLDPFGLPVPPEMAGVFDPALEEKRKEILSAIKGLAVLVNEYASSPAGAYVREELRRLGKNDDEIHYVDQGLVEARRRFEQMTPHCSVCPYCHVTAGKTLKNCNACKGMGWVPVQMFDKNRGAPRDYIEAVEALKEGGEQ